MLSNGRVLTPTASEPFMAGNSLPIIIDFDQGIGKSYIYPFTDISMRNRIILVVDGDVVIQLYCGFPPLCVFIRETRQCLQKGQLFREKYRVPAAFFFLKRRSIEIFE